MSEWREVALGDVCTKITSGGTPRRSCAANYAHDGRGHRWVKSSELLDGYVRSTSEHLTDRGLTESAAKLLPAGAVLIAMYGATAGRVGLLKTEAAVNQAVCGLLLNSERADPVFVFHALRSMRRELAANAAGAAQQNLNAAIIRSFPLVIPDLATQRRIATLFAAFDELIEINERRIELLEDLTRSLYREWFVRFRFPGHHTSGSVAPADGPNPEGWAAGVVGDFLQVIGGGTPAKGRDEYWQDGTIDWYTPSDLTRSKSRFTNGSANRITPLGVEKSSARCFPAGSVLMTSRATLGVLALASQDAACNQGFIVLPPVDGIPPTFLYEWLADHNRELETIATGATFKEITKGAFKRVPFVRPALDLLHRFGAIVAPFEYQIATCERANHALARTRDLLLPRLVTGRLDISDIDLGNLLPDADAA